jgi:hopene-associated glycosyltransferase HpnB
MTLTLIAFLTLGVWLYLIAVRGGFWMAAERDDRDEPAAPADWPAVIAVIPARDEAETIGQTIGSLLRQDYPGRLSVILVDDDSRDGTAAIARDAAARLNAEARLTVMPGQPLPPGWTGKLWALRQGIEAAETRDPDYLLLTDADITYAPDALRKLVARAASQGTVLTSLMAKLNCESFAEKLLVPAFIFFFQMLYPFTWTNRPDHRTAAAAGGCMLLRPDALRAAGGIGAIRGALIDDCSLAQKMKRQGPIWLGLTDRVHSIRPYPRLDDIRRMVVRSAYAQLRFSPLLLAGTIVGMAVTYLAAPLLTFFASGIAQVMGLFVWILMALAFVPVLRFYRLSPLWSIALPVIAAIYMAFTLDSAYQHWRGRGGVWKGRVQAHLSEQP